MASTDDIPDEPPATEELGATPPTQPGAGHEPLPAGTRVGRYVVEGRIGAGGMGAVYRAHDPELDRLVALKIMHAAGAPEAARARLAQEAKALARLSHPHVCVVYDVETHDGHLVVAMEHIDGPNLQQLRPLAPARALELYRQAGRGLLAAHAAGIVHRDFKPANVLVGRDGRVRVVDFGLAQGSDEGTRGGDDFVSDPLLTATGSIVGTPAYMAPEQWARERATPRSDQFSFCVSLWEALAGARPFAGRPETWSAPFVAEGRTLAPAVRAALERGLALDPRRRWPSMAELLAALEPRRRSRRLLVAAGALAIAAASAAAVAAVVGRHADPCSGLSATVAAAWGPERREALRRRLLASELPEADELARRTVGRLDLYAGRWLDTRTQLCRAPVVSLEKTTCLDQRLSYLRALVDELLGGPAASLERAGRAAAALEEPATCEAAEILDMPVPHDPDLRARMLALRTRLTIGLSFARLGRGEDRLDEIVAAARALGHKPLLALALVVAGAVRADRNERDEAEALVLEALDLAQETRYIRVQVDAWTSLAELHAARGRFDEAHRAIRNAEALLRPFGPEADGLRASALASEGLIFGQQKLYPIALRQLERALEIRVRRDGPDSLKVAGDEGYLGWLCNELEWWDRANQHNLRALEIHRRAGSESATIVGLLQNLGGAALEQGNGEAGLRYYGEALALREAHLPAGHPQLGLSHLLVGRALARLGRHAEAESHFRTAIAIYEARPQRTPREEGFLEMSREGLRESAAAPR